MPVRKTVSRENSTAFRWNYKRLTLLRWILMSFEAVQTKYFLQTSILLHPSVICSCCFFYLYVLSQSIQTHHHQFSASHKICCDSWNLRNIFMRYTGRVNILSLLKKFYIIFVNDILDDYSNGITIWNYIHSGFREMNYINKLGQFHFRCVLLVTRVTWVGPGCVTKNLLFGTSQA